MTMLVPVIAWLIATPVCLVSAYLCLELVLGWARSRRRASATGTARTFVFLIPAHDEESGIGATVSSLVGQLQNGRVVVVADNCSDRTAEVALAAGAEVVVRSDPARRGKGHALAFGRERLAMAPPDVVIVLDADCRISAGGGQALARAVEHQCGPIQCVNLVTSSPDATPLQRISTFAMLVKNLVRARGLQRLGGSIPLFGTGMAFPWELFAKLPLASDNKVEDIELGVHLARQGIRIILEDGVLVTSPAASAAASRDQRRRWEHGFLQMASQHAMPLLFRGVIQRSRQMTTFGLHMSVPPIALHCLLGGLALALLGAIHILGGPVAPLAATALAMGSVIFFLGITWLLFGRNVIGLSDLLCAPLYVLWKIPLYIGYFTRRQMTWNRTPRND